MSLQIAVLGNDEYAKTIFQTQEWLGNAEIRVPHHEILIVETLSDVPDRAVLVMTAPEAMHFPNKYLRVAAHDLLFGENGFSMNGHAHPFVIAIRHPDHAIKHIITRQSPDGEDLEPKVIMYDISMYQMARALSFALAQYANWWPGKADQPVPWDVDLKTLGGEQHARLVSWQQLVAEREIVPTPSQVLSAYGTPLSGVVGMHQVKTLYITGCALFNEPHTDIAARFIPSKLHGLLQHLRRIIQEVNPEEVVFSIAGADMTTHPALKASLHPFFWADINELRKRLPGHSFGNEPRLCGNLGRRLDDAVAVSMQHNFDLMYEHVVGPIMIDFAEIVVRAETWIETYSHETLDWAWSLANSPMVRAIAQAHYIERVSKFFWYSLLDRALGIDAGLLRMTGNNSLYIADYLYFSQQPDTVVLSYEGDHLFWDALQPFFAQLAHLQNIETPPNILAAPVEVCQPWTYVK